jgi:hypothetical protein
MPWWLWLLGSLALSVFAVAVHYVAHWLMDKGKDGVGLGCAVAGVGVVLALAALLVGGIGLVQFVRWAWG